MMKSRSHCSRDVPLSLIAGTGSWALLRSSSMGEALRPSLNTLAANILADLVAKGLLKRLGVSLSVACLICPSLFLV